MNIDRSNFRELYQRITHHVQDSDFLSIACLPSGIALEYEQTITKFDSDEDIYQKMKHTAQNYHLLCVGLTVYTFCAVERKYIARPYTVHLNPSYSTHAESIKKQVMQLECLGRMSDQGFDFTRIYKQGLSYMKLAEIEDKGVKITKTKTEHSAIGLSAKNKTEMERILLEVDEFEKNPTSKEVNVDCKTSYLANKIIRRQLREDIFHGKTLMVEKGQSDHLLIVRKKKPGWIGRSTDFRVEEDRDEIDSQGFTLIMQAIIESKRPIVGHAVGLDVMFLYSHFVGNLPSKFVDYVAQVHKVFPRLIDTKVLATQLKGIVRLPQNIEALYSAAKQDTGILAKFNNVVVSQDMGQLQQSVTKDVGYYAYIAGVAFVSLCYYHSYSQHMRVQKPLSDKSKKQNTAKELQLQNRIYQNAMHAYIDPHFAQANLNYIYNGSGGKMMHVDLVAQQARNPLDIEHRSELIASTIYFECDASIARITPLNDVIASFAKYGDVNVTLANDLTNGFAEYDAFELFDDIEDKVGQLLPLLVKCHPMITKVTRYSERPQFKAYLYFN